MFEIDVNELHAIILACERQRDRFREMMRDDPEMVPILAGGVDIYAAIIHKLKRETEK